MIFKGVTIIISTCLTTLVWSMSYEDSTLPLHKFWSVVGPYLGKPIVTNASSLSLRTFYKKEKNKYWPNAVVPYIIDVYFDVYEKKKILKAMKLFEQVSCVRWVPRTTETDYIKFRLSGSYCSSRPGRAGGKQTVNLKEDCFYNEWYRGAIVHEMMHVLGFVHEQQRDDRDCYVKVTGDGSSMSDVGFIFGLDTKFPYDFNSIMHYKERDYLKGRRGERLGNKVGTLTDMDKWKLNHLYCGKPHFCDVNPHKCREAETAERLCRAVEVN